MDLVALADALNQRFAPGQDWGWRATGSATQLNITGPGPWAPHTYTQNSPNLSVEAILDEAWSSHCQYLAVIFGQERAACKPAA